jgi:hypothetical protein
VTTPYWYPCQTNAGAIREDRLVFPIPPGTHWSEVKPIILPGEDRVPGVGCRVPGEERKRLKGSVRNPKPETRNPGPGPGKVAILVGGRIKYIDRPGYVAQKGGVFDPEDFGELSRAAQTRREPAPAVFDPEALFEPEPQSRRQTRRAKAKKQPRPKAKNDPKLVAAARELRDRYLEHINDQPLLPQGKYDVSRALVGPPVAGVVERAPLSPATAKQLPNAA